MSTITSLLPLVFLLVAVAALSWIGYQVYLYSLTLKSTTEQHMAKHNVRVSRENGLKVGVKETSTEKYADRLQKGLVDTWNAAEIKSGDANGLGRTTSRQGGSV